MELHVRFTYPVSYVPFRCSVARTAHFAGETRVAIREVRSDEVEPAFRLNDLDHHRFAKAGGGTRLMVGYGGKLWLETIDAARLADAFATQIYVQQSPFSYCNHLNLRNRGYQHCEVHADDAMAIHREHPGNMRDWQDDGGESMARKLARRAEDMIIVDGIVYVRDYEPCWYLGYNRLGLASVRIDPGEPFTDAYPSPFDGATRFWRADRRDEALAAARAAEMRDGGAVLEVLNPSFLRYADDSTALHKLAGTAASFLEYVLPRLPVEVAESFYDLREGFESAGGHVGSKLLDAVEQIATLPPMAIAQAGPAAAAVQQSVENAKSLCREAMQRWHNRPDDDSEWYRSGLSRTATLQNDFLVREILDRDKAGRLARGLGIDLSDFEHIAAQGDGHLFSLTSSPP